MSKNKTLFSFLVISLLFPKFFVSTAPAFSMPIPTPVIAATAASPSRVVKNAQQKFKKPQLSFVLSAEVGINFLRGVKEIETQNFLTPSQIQAVSNAIIKNYDKVVDFLTEQAEEHAKFIVNVLQLQDDEDEGTVILEDSHARFDEVYQALKARDLYVEDLLSKYLSHKKQPFQKCSSQGTLRGKLNMQFPHNVTLSPMVSVTCRNFNMEALSLQSGVSLGHRDTFIAVESSYNLVSKKRNFHLTFGKEFSTIWELFGRPVSLKLEGFVVEEDKRTGEDSFIQPERIPEIGTLNGNLCATIDLIKFEQKVRSS